MSDCINADPAFPAAFPKVVDTGNIVADIGAMLDGCGVTNRNELLIVAIIALIEAGVTTGSEIVGAARALGYNVRHAGAVLGSDEGYRWRRNAGGRFELIEAGRA